MRKRTAIITGALLVVTLVASTSLSFATSNNSYATASKYNRYYNSNKYNNSNTYNSRSSTQFQTSKTKVVKVDVSWFDYNNPKKSYTINNEAQLRGLASLVNKKQSSWKPNRYESFEGVEFKLTNDIKLKYGWTPIGHSEDVCFKGTFDGDGHTISGLDVTSGNEYSGLFGYLGGTVKNLSVEGEVTSSTSWTGAIVGKMGISGSIISCTANATVIGKDKTGGIIGENRGGIVNGCVNHGKVRGTYKVGGIVGENFGGKVTECGNYANVVSTTRNIGIYGTGGIAGRSISTGSVVGKSFNKGDITSATEGTGGVVGYCNAQGARVSSCYNTGNIVEHKAKYGKKTSLAYVGGVIGIVGDSAVKVLNNYNNGTGIGGNFNGGVIGYYQGTTTLSEDGNIKNNYYLNTDFRYGIGKYIRGRGANIDNVITGISSSTLNSYTYKLSSNFMQDSSGLYGNGGAPVLRWQQPISEEEKEYISGVSLKAQKRLDKYMNSHSKTLKVGQLVIDIFNTTNLLSDVFHR